MITVFYDGACGVCSREIRHYQRIAPDGVFNWCDIMQEQARLAEAEFSLEDAMLTLHALDHYGRAHKGVDAFILIWRHIPTWQFAAILVSLPVIKPITEALYRRFADWRFRRSNTCEIDPAQPKKNAQPNKELANQ